MSDVGYASAYRRPAATNNDYTRSLAVSGRACPPFLVDCSLSLSNVANVPTGFVTWRYTLSRKNFEDVSSKFLRPKRKPLRIDRLRWLARDSKVTNLSVLRGSAALG